MKTIRWDGRSVSAPGLYSGMSLATYHRGDVCDGPSISSSGLRTIFTKSPAHYWAASPLNDDPDDDVEDESDSQALIFGSAVHHLILGEDNFSGLYVMRPDKLNGEPWQGNKTICRDWLKAQAAEGRTVLTRNEMRAIRGMARSLSKDPLVQAGCLNGGVELSLFWKDKETGIWLKSRPDTIPYDSLDVVDLKTTTKFGDDLDKAIFADFRYDMQGELVRWGMREVLGVEMASFTLIFVEKKQPYSVEAVTIGFDHLESAGHDLRMALRTFKHCLGTGNWFGPAGTQMDARFAFRSQWAETRASYQRSVLEREIARPATGE